MRYDDDDELDDLRYDSEDDDDDSDYEDRYRRLDDDDDDEEDDDDESLGNSYRGASNPPRSGSGLPGPGSLRPGTGSQPPASRFGSGGSSTGSTGSFQRPGSTPPAKPESPFGGNKPTSPFGSPRPASPFNNDKPNTGSGSSQGGAKPPFGSDKGSTGPLSGGGAKPPFGSDKPSTGNLSGGAKPPASPLSPSRPSPTYGSGGGTGSTGTFQRTGPGPSSGGNPPPRFGSSPSSPFNSDRSDTGPLKSNDKNDTGPLRSTDTGSQRAVNPSSPFSSKPSPFSDPKRDTKDSPAVGPRKDDGPAGSKPGDAKKDDKPAGGGGFGSFRDRMTNMASSVSSSLPIGKKDDKPADGKKDDKPGSSGDKKDDKPAGGGFMSRVSGLASNLPSSLPIGKKDDKPADGKKDDKPAFGSKPAAAGDKKDDKPAGGASSFMSRMSNMATSAASSLPIGKKDDKPADGKPAASGDKKDDKPAGGGAFGSFRDRMSSAASSLPFGKKDDKPADTKAEAQSVKPGSPSTPSGGSGSPFSSSGSSTSSSSGSGFSNTPKPGPFGGGSSSSSSSSTPSSGGSGSPFSNTPKPSPFGGGSSPSSSSGSGFSSPDKKASGEVKAATPAASSSAPASSGPRFGALGGAKPADKPADTGKKDDKPAATAAPTQRQSPLGMIRGVLGRNPAPATAPDTPVKGGKADPKVTAKGGKAVAASAAPTASPVSAIMGRFKRVLGVSEAPPTKARGSRVPTAKSIAADEGGLTLDNWLDIIGVACTVGSLTLFFSALSPDRAAIGIVLSWIGQLFGWGALIVPIVLFVIGMWLIVRHFGDEPPVIDFIRVLGFGLAFVTLLLVFQYIDSFSYRNIVTNGSISYDLLQLRVDYSWRKLQDGGGAIGGILYLFLITSFSELGGIFVVLFLGIVSLMLITRQSASEMAMVSISMWRSNRDRLQQRAIARRMKRQMAAAELSAQQPQIRIEAPAPEMLPAGAQAALPAPMQAPPIRFNRGVLPESVSVQQATQTALPNGAIPYPTPPVKEDSGGGLFSRFRRGNRETGTSAPVVSEGSRGWFNRGNTPAVAPALPSNPLPHDDMLPPAPPAMPAASVGRPPEPTRTASLSDLLSNTPATPAINADRAPAPPAPSPLFAAASAALDGETPVQTPPAASVPPVAATTPASPFAAPVDDQQARLDRMNAIRNGQLTPPSAPATAPAPEEMITPASQLPSVQGRVVSSPLQESLSIPPAAPPAQPVVTNTTRQRTQWKLPDVRTLLAAGSDQEVDRAKLLRQAKMIEDTLTSFDSPGRVVEVNTGPVITQFGIEPGFIARSGKQQRIKVGAIAALDKDLQLALGAKSIRIEAPVPGKGYVGVEVPNDEPALVSLRDVMDSPGFSKHKSPLGIALGQSVSGVPISADLASMPHVLIAGTTGSGKSVCVNAIIVSILVRHTPEEVRFIMVDPKRVELTGYNGIPHLVAPVVVELERIVGVLKWVTREMDERYRKFSEAGARNIEDFNKHRDPATELMPYIVVIIDELADLMMLAPEETERTITRIAALARATGIHLVLATQRPSVDVVTGLIKANFPARIAFAVAGSVDSRVILDQPGAERLLGRGDMLYLSGDSPAPLRLQGVYVSDMEIQNVVRFWKTQAVENPDVTRPAVIFSSSGPSPIPEGGMTRATAKQSGMWTDQGKHPTTTAPAASAPSRFADPFEDDYDEPDEDDGDEGDVDDDLYERAVDMVRRLEKASVSMLQRKLRIGYTRAARLIDVMEERGVVGKAKDGSSKPRDVLPPK